MSENVAIEAGQTRSVTGALALILALAGLPEGQVGHYGVDDGADSLLPPRRP